MTKTTANAKITATAAAKRELKAKLTEAGIPVTSIGGNSRWIAVMVKDAADRERAIEVVGGTPSDYNARTLYVTR